MEKAVWISPRILKIRKMKLITFVLIIFLWQKSYAQKDIIYKNDSTQIRCKILKVTATNYQYAYTDDALKVLKTSILKTLVDSVKQNFYDSNIVQHKIFATTVKPITANVVVAEPASKNWLFTVGIGVNLGNVLEFNNPSGGGDKKSLSGTVALDVGINYAKQNTRFSCTNELHYLFGLQKSGLTSAAHIQRISDELTTLHDLSIQTGKTKKWNFNLIAKSTLSFFTIYDGEYFKDINSLGKIQAFLSPYDVTISPGIKYQPDKYFRISISPYSFKLYGVQSNQISSKGLFITDLNSNGNYKKFLYKRLGAEVNFWYDRQVKQWLTMQYRLSFSSDYFEKFGKNGLMDGLFITKIKIVKAIYLTHRATVKSNLAVNFLKPYFNQNILLSYSKNF